MNQEEVRQERERNLTARLTELYTNYQSLGLDRLRQEACEIYSDIFLDSDDFKDAEDPMGLAEAMMEVQCWEMENGFTNMDLYFDAVDR